MQSDSTFTAFSGVRRVAEGTLRDVLPILKRRFDKDSSESLLVFDTETGRQVDFDLRGSLEQVLEREASAPQRGPGRPRLGVTSREVSLLPRHWDWLEEQPSGASPALRRLVEHASKTRPGKERARRIRAALSQFLSAMAGDRPNYEEACRALFAGDGQRFKDLIDRWPKDIRDHALSRASEAGRAENDDPSGANPSALVVAELHTRIWNQGDYSMIGRLVAPRYVIHSDPGDPWEGRILDRSAYEERVRYSRNAFPDLAFTILDLLATEDRVAARWRADGTQRGDLANFPPPADN